ncbi:MAG: L,D-transpeptidase family protein [Bacteroidota bacterium]
MTAGYYFWPEKQLPENAKADKLVVHKAKRSLEFWSEGKLLKTYTISLGKTPIGDKQFEGDMKTPEGTYTINERNPNSGYFLNLGVSYPNKTDIEEARKLGKSPGGLIKIHGLKNGQGHIGKFHRFKDWTHGCIAVTNEEMQELYDQVPNGTPIEINP